MFGASDVQQIANLLSPDDFVVKFNGVQIVSENSDGFRAFSPAEAEEQYEHAVAELVEAVGHGGCYMEELPRVDQAWRNRNVLDDSPHLRFVAAVEAAIALDVERCLIAGGLARRDLADVRARLLR